MPELNPDALLAELEAAGRAPPPDPRQAFRELALAERATQDAEAARDPKASWWARNRGWLVGSPNDPIPRALRGATAAIGGSTAEPGAPEPDLMRYGLNTATFGLADKAIAGGATLPLYAVNRLMGGPEASPGSIYRQLSRDLAAGQQATEQAHPYMAPAAGLAASVVSGPSILGLLGRGAAGLDTLSRTALLGGVADRIGALGRGAATLVNARAPTRALAQVARGATEGGGAAALTSAVEGRDIGTGLGESAGMGAALGAAFPVAQGAGRFVRALKNQVLPSRGYASTNAERLLENSLLSDRANIPQLQQELATSGRPLTIADVGGENVRARAEAAYKRPGEGREAATQTLVGRMEAQPDRVAADLSTFLTPGAARSAEATLDSLTALRRAHADPFYKQAYAFGRVASTDLAPFLPRLQAAGALQHASDFAGIEGRPFTAGDTLAKGMPAIEMRDIDFIQRGLRQSIENSLGEHGVPTARTLSLQGLRNQFLEVVDDLNPAFKKARAIYADDSSAIDAVKQGRNLLRGNPESSERLLRYYRGLDAGDQDYFRIGLAQHAMDLINKAPDAADAAKKLLLPAVRNRLRPVFDSDEAYQGFVKAMRQEALMGRTSTRMIGGSRTFTNLAEDSNMGSELLLDAAQAATRAATSGSLHHLLSPLLTRFERKLRDPTMDRRTASELQRILFNPDAADNQAILQRILERRGQAQVPLPGGGLAPASDLTLGLSRGTGALQALESPILQEQP